jgi:hypothetical protein
MPKDAAGCRDCSCSVCDGMQQEQYVHATSGGLWLLFTGGCCWVTCCTAWFHTAVGLTQASMRICLPAAASMLACCCQQCSCMLTFSGC